MPQAVANGWGTCCCASATATVSARQCAGIQLVNGHGGAVSQRRRKDRFLDIFAVRCRYKLHTRDAVTGTRTVREIQPADCVIVIWREPAS